MAQPTHECPRCGRVRRERHMTADRCVHGVTWRCSAAASCRSIAKANRKAARDAGV